MFGCKSDLGPVALDGTIHPFFELPSVISVIVIEYFAGFCLSMLSLQWSLAFPFTLNVLVSNSTALSLANLKTIVKR